EDHTMPSPVTSALAAAAAPGFVLERSAAVPALIGRHEDFLFISGLGGRARDVGAVTGDGAHVSSLGGAMGAACMMGLGLALARRRGRHRRGRAAAARGQRHLVRQSPRQADRACRVQAQFRRRAVPGSVSGGAAAAVDSPKGGTPHGEGAVLCYKTVMTDTAK